MTLRGSADAKVLVGGYDVTPLLSRWEDEAAAQTEDNTPLGQAISTEAFVGIAEGTVTVEGWWDDTVWDAPFLTGQPGAAVGLMALPAGNAANRRAIVAPGMLQANVKRIIERGGLTKASMEYAQNAGRVLYGQCIAHHVQRGVASTTDADDSDWGVGPTYPTTTGFWLAVNMTQLALGGYTNVVLTLRDSADGSSWLAVAGGPSLTFTAIGAQAALSTVSLRRYVSLSWTWTGAGAANTFTAAAAVGRNPA